VIPGEIYPAEVRATCHGFSAAAGKLGAATGAYLFPLLLSSSSSSSFTSKSLDVDNGLVDTVTDRTSVAIMDEGVGMRRVMFCCAAVALAGAVVTALFTPSYDGTVLAMKEHIENDKNDMDVLLDDDDNDEDSDDTDEDEDEARDNQIRKHDRDEDDQEDGDEEDDRAGGERESVEDAVVNGEANPLLNWTTGAAGFSGFFGNNRQADEQAQLLLRTSYIPLDYVWLRPSMADLRLLMRESDQYFNSYHNLSTAVPATATAAAAAAAASNNRRAKPREHKKRKDGYEMLEIIQSADNYALDDF
jgi:hypothetical protein